MACCSCLVFSVLMTYPPSSAPQSSEGDSGVGAAGKGGGDHLASRTELEASQRARLEQFRAALEAEEAIAKKRLEEGSEAVLAEYRRTMEVRSALN
jgi:hypothetical protein